MQFDRFFYNSVFKVNEEEFSVKSLVLTILFKEEEFSAESLHHAIWRIFVRVRYQAFLNTEGFVSNVMSYLVSREVLVILKHYEM